ncbi:MAG: T9SS type A sorting domain-containing protein [Saprospiraceae bacterium]
MCNWTTVTLLTLLAPVAAFGTQFFVAPNGSPANDGSFISPWDLQTAFDQPAAVLPGDTIWLRGGTYFGNPNNTTQNEVAGFVSRLNGTVDRPIIVRQYPGERAVIDGGNRPHPVQDPPAPDSYTLGILGDHCWYWGFEVTDSNTHARADSSSGFRWRVGSIISIGTGIRFINLVVHDTGSGLGPFSGCVGCEVYGCVIFYNGWSHLGVRGHGEGMYGQNDSPTKFIRDNIVFKQFDSGIILYGTANSTINNFHLEGNIVFANGTINDDPNGWGFLLGKNSTASGPGNNFVIRDNYLYNRFDYLRSNNLDMGYQSGLNNVQFQNNYSAGRWSVRNNLPVTNLSATGNTLVGELYPVSAAQISPDSNTILPATPLPTANAVFVRPNIYEPGRAHVVAYNWLKLPTVNADLTNAGLAAGDMFDIFDVQNFFGPVVVSGAFDPANPTVSLPTNLTAVTGVIGEKVPRPAVHTDNVFNVFLVKKREQSVGTNAPDQNDRAFIHFFDASARRLTLHFSGTHGNLQAQVLDVTGRVLVEKTTADTEARIDLSGVPAGVYVVSVQQGAWVRSEWFLVPF